MWDFAVEPEMDPTRAAAKAQSRSSLAGRRRIRGICSESQNEWKRVITLRYLDRVESAQAWSNANCTRDLAAKERGAWFDPCEKKDSTEENSLARFESARSIGKARRVM